MPKLSQANLAYHNASQRRSDEAPITQPVKRWLEENEPYRTFLATGHSAQAKDDKRNEHHPGMSVIRWRFIARNSLMDKTGGGKLGAREKNPPAYVNGFSVREVLRTVLVGAVYLERNNNSSDRAKDAAFW